MTEAIKLEIVKKAILDSMKELPLITQLRNRNGDPVKNQFEVAFNGGRLFQSYSSPIAYIKDGMVFIFRDWNYSTTTSKYRNQFLRETTQQTLKKLKSGEYIAVDFEVSQ